jgi:F-type H+-transporting ATPase subunit alpha
MKQIAGQLRLDLAQYRELVTFAQFGTELDKASQAQLERGERLTEILKQGQYSPLAVEKQILVIYAGNRGFLDDFSIDQIESYEKRLFEYYEREHPELLKEIIEKKEISADLDEKINKAMTAFNKEFKGENE